MEDIADLNGVMSVRRFVLSTMLAGVAVYGACLLYRINYIAALFVMILAVIMIPGLVRNYFMERSKASRFADVDVYLHQMTYSFIRNPKVNIALQDAYAISSGRLKRCLSRAIEELQYGMGERVYEDALKIVEEEYDCSRIRTLHKFLVSVEEKGGRYTGAMEVLLEDFDRWVNNVYKYQSEIRKTFIFSIDFHQSASNCKTQCLRLSGETATAEVYFDVVLFSNTQLVQRLFNYILKNA